MKNLLKVTACLYACMAAISAETIVFDGHRDHGALLFDVETHGNDSFTLKSVKINESRLNPEEIKDITLVIPGTTQGKQTYIGREAFCDLRSDRLRLKIQFRTTIREGGPMYAQLPRHCNSMFDCSRSITEIDFKGANTSAVNSMAFMFFGCTGLSKIDFSDFDTSNVTNMIGMFYSCLSLRSLDLDHFDTFNVTNMAGMFCECSSLGILDLRKFDTSNVTDMKFMFNKCKNLRTLDLSNFDTSNVTDMSWMFDECERLETLDLSNFDTREVTTMYSVFRNCNNLALLKYGEHFVTPEEHDYMFDGYREDLIH